MVNKILKINILFLFLFSCAPIKKTCINFEEKNIVFENLSPNSFDFCKIDLKIFQLKDMLNGSSTCEMEIKENFVEIDFDFVKNSKLLSTYSAETDYFSWKEFKTKFLINDKLYYVGSCNYINNTIHFMLCTHTRSFNIEKEKIVFMIIENSFRNVILVVGSCLDQYSDNSVLSTTKYNGSYFIYRHFIDSDNFFCSNYIIDNSGNIQFIHN